MQNPVPRRFWRFAFVLLLIASAGLGYEVTRASGATGSDEILGFDMWCLDMRTYPAERCDARRPEDVKAYEQYRATAEKYDQARATREKRDQELQQRLNRDTAGTKSGPLSK